MMQPTRALILATLVLMFSACGGPAEPDRGATEPASSQTAETADTAEKAASGPAEQPIEVIEESAGDNTTAQEKAGDKIVLAQDETPAAPVAR